MSILKRLVYIIFSVSALIVAASYMELVFGRYSQTIVHLFETNYTFCYLIVGATAIVALFALVQLLRALFVRNRKLIEIARTGHDAIYITRDAISSHVRLVCEEGDEFAVRRVRVRAKKHGHIKIYLRVEALASYSAVGDGEKLQERLKQSLHELLGEAVESIVIEFASTAKESVYPEVGLEFSLEKDDTEDADTAAEISATDHDNSEVTVPMGYYSGNEESAKEV